MAFSRLIVRRGAGRLFLDQINENFKRLFASMKIAAAENEILKTYGDTVSVEEKGKSLNKFGRNLAVGTTFETVAEFQGTTANETFVTSNIIDSISSSSTSDTSQTITIEGHTYSGGNLTFVVQDAALNGQTKVTLSTPLFRATRAHVKATGTALSFPSALVGTVYVYDDTDGISSGVPTTAAATKLTILAGETQSEKCATATSSVDYWLLTTFSAGIGNAGAASVDTITVRIERRDVANGGAWRPTGRDIVLVPGQVGKEVLFEPLPIIPPNHDIRVVAKTNANTAEVFAEIRGYLAKII